MPLPSPDPTTASLARAAVPLRSLSADAPTTDLQPLRQVLDGVRIIGLGEATHGTREFFRLKHRLLAFLVRELGCTALAMEASESAAPAVDAYVRSGVGSAEQAVAGLGFWTWQTREVLAMVEWMRTYNRQRPASERVRFLGIDPQKCGPSLTALDTLLGRLPAPERNRATALLAPLHTLATAHPGSQPDPERQLVRGAEELSRLLTPYGSDAARHARNLVRAADLVTRPRQHTDPEQTVFAVRDRYMADALEAEPSAKIALWAHNGHIGTTHHGGGALRPLGSHLRDRHGDAYYALALLFGSGAFRARRTLPGPWQNRRARTRDAKVPSHRIGPPAPNTVEAQLASATPTDHFLDLRTAPEPVRAWAAVPHPHRSFGAMVPRWTYHLHHTPVTLTATYDGLAYIAASSPSEPFPHPTA
ncbi:succinoglycan biosynthesis [Streptomyces spiroverticillatus]|uniref:Succinoglycan biosynthesis n=1 Tax=Streptomyces finlayi TaxID=67296 RepID=A0A919CA34_9ACTN|nr:erythromycin esterase family protein [Streptomyces finlayi]GHA07661.1 succinoglycan biosynthesis [Streptomyces spiroverticillatus]GHC90943.1 succinoglycan biosynthesis [Streptomyces finlayi]